eukprot:1160705-Pelagomonas_calceolata.AAC.4
MAWLKPWGTGHHSLQKGTPQLAMKNTTACNEEHHRVRQGTPQPAGTENHSLQAQGTTEAGAKHSAYRHGTPQPVGAPTLLGHKFCLGSRLVVNSTVWCLGRNESQKQ